MHCSTIVILNTFREITKMTDENPSYDTSDPDIFSRGSLKMTYDLLRKKDAILALNVRNIIHAEPLPKINEDTGNEHSDLFRVELDSFQVRAIVEGLMELTQGETTGDDNPGMAVMAKTLVEDWIKLARKMIAELPEDQKKPTIYH